MSQSATLPLAIVAFSLTPQVPRRTICATFLFAVRSVNDSGGPDRFSGAGSTFTLNASAEAWSPPEQSPRVISEGGKACSTCLVGRFNASIRNARREATGSARPRPARKFAATATRRFTTFRLRWPRACGCVLARWAVTARRGALPGVRGSRQGRAFGPARPDPIGASRPRRFPPSAYVATSLIRRSKNPALECFCPFRATREFPSMGRYRSR